MALSGFLSQTGSYRTNTVHEHLSASNLQSRREVEHMTTLRRGDGRLERENPTESDSRKIIMETLVRIDAAMTMRESGLNDTMEVSTD